MDPVYHNEAVVHISCMYTGQQTDIYAYIYIYMGVAAAKRKRDPAHIPVWNFKVDACN